MLAAVVDAFRYAQFCPVARAAEVLGQRWNLLVLRELLLGPQRFSDLRRRLTGVSPSVLTERLASLESAGIVGRRELPPPAPATVYELTEVGRSFEPAMLALVRWGLRLMTPPEPGDHVEPDWVRLAVVAFAQRGPSPARRIELRAREGDRQAAVRVAGGPRGTRLLADDEPVDAVLAGAPVGLLGAMSGGLDLAQALREGTLSMEGDAGAARDLPLLFDLAPTSPEADAEAPASPSQKGNTA